MTADPASAPTSSPSPLAWLNRFGLMVREVTHEDRSWLHIQHATLLANTSPSDEERTVHVSDTLGIRVRYDKFPQFVKALQTVLTVVGGTAPPPDFAALADRYRFAENADAPSQRNVTLARLFAALAAEGGATDSKFLRDLDRVVAEYHPELVWKHWGVGAPSRTGRGVEATAKTLLLEHFHALCALDDAALDRRVEEHRAPLIEGEPPSDPSVVDREYAIASEILTSIWTAMPHLDPRTAQDGASAGRATTVAVYPTVTAQGQAARLVVQRLPEGSSSRHDAPTLDAVERLATHLREMRCRRRDESRGAERGMFLRPDDAEPVLRKALRIAGLDATKAEGFFKFLDQRAGRAGADVGPKNRDQRRRAERQKRKGRS